MALHLDGRASSAAVATAMLLALASGCGTSRSAGTQAAPLAGTTVSLQATATASHRRASQPRTTRTTRHGSAAGTLAVGHRTKTTGCRVRGQLPDPACTPGGVFPRATVTQICSPGYSESVRNVPESVKRQVYAAYGIASHAPGSYEVDHLISLELGGDNSIANLWPEASPGYHEKDRIENELHDAVCAGRVSLRSAQRQIAHDWRHTAAGSATA